MRRINVILEYGRTRWRSLLEMSLEILRDEFEFKGNQVRLLTTEKGREGNTIFFKLVF